MTVLITVRNGQQMLGRCDATCYNAKGHRCRCVCGGINHGAGIKWALTYTQQLHQHITKHIKKRLPQADLITFYQADIPFHFHAPQPNPHALPLRQPYTVSEHSFGSLKLEAVMFPVQKNGTR